MARSPVCIADDTGAKQDPSRDEADLVRTAAAGDRAAFETLYSRYARMVHGILLARAGPAEAEDLVQDVFLTAFRKVSGLRLPEAFPSWLASIARNRAMDYYRTVRQHEDASRAICSDGITHPESRALEVLDIIRQLPEAYRETLMLRLVEGMTGPEIAQRTGLTSDSVRVNLSRGIKLLRERLQTSASI